MMKKQPQRALWLLSHATARTFEIEQLKLFGINEIYLPKIFPYDDASSSVNYEEDAFLSIPSADLAILNAQNWYENPSREAWDIVNRHFDIVIIGCFIRQIESAVHHFKGSIVLRAFGLTADETYSRIIRSSGGEQLELAIRKCGKRFSFGIGYESLVKNELRFLADRAVFLPVGLSDKKNSLSWEGNSHCILFVCPRIESNHYYNQIYKDFIDAFGDFDYIISGEQPIKVNDPRVLGFIPDSLYAHHMQQSRVMFYHSQEPNRIHCRPFEAIRANMPLVFMAGGMLDQMGGKKLPGRAKTIGDARKKIKRILKGDWKFIRQIQESQKILLKPMSSEYCKPLWQTGLKKIFSNLAIAKKEEQEKPTILRPRKRVAIILPLAYRGGSLRGAQLLAHAIHLGSRQCNEPVDVVFLHLDNPKDYPEEEFSGLPATIQRRCFSWKKIPADDAHRSMVYAGFESWKPRDDYYFVPNDGMRQLQDCDLWIVVSDRLLFPLLPLRPIVLMIYDYIQRYEKSILGNNTDQPCLEAARLASRVFVTTEFTHNDAINYAGISPQKLRKLPMLCPKFTRRSTSYMVSDWKYFLWTTNETPHKNHENALNALRIYYDEFSGKMDCRVTGVNTKRLLDEKLHPHLESCADIFFSSEILQKRIRWAGELPTTEYQRTLEQAAFLWHPTRIDNGTFSVVEAAHLGIPSLSSNYPAMREIDKQFSLNLSWMDPHSPRDMAKQLKFMEENATFLRTRLPTEEELATQNLDALAHCYWEEVRECL
jgi:glycosyltransferase involved in cell wall biosynthesis